MRRIFSLLSVLVLVILTAVLAHTQDTKSQPEQSTDASAPIPQLDVDKKNPVKPTADGLAEARKLYGYHCAMCHGKGGDGKGDLAGDMKLQLNDWRDTSSISKYSDGALFYIVSNGRGKMVGEGDRTSDTVRWNLVNLVRSFGKKNEQATKQP